jgi:hypothetical protein
MNSSSQNIISGICGVGIALFCESEYSCLILFKRRTSLFFFMCQLAICSNAAETALAISICLLPNLRVLPMLVMVLISDFTQNMSYPIMMLLRLRIVHKFPVIIMCIPVVLSVLLTIPGFFWIYWVLTGKKYDFNISFIVQLITTITLTAEFIIINIFFIMIAIKYFQDIVHIKSIIIVNIIAIIFECVALLVQFLISDQWIILSVTSIVPQIILRLEIVTLSYIVHSAEVVREQLINSEYESQISNKFCHIFDFFLSRIRATGLTT